MDFYEPNTNDAFWSEKNAYEVLAEVGRGGFGVVVKCRKNCSDEIVAVKIIRNKPHFTKAGKNEAELLSKLSEDSICDFNMVRFHEQLFFRDHVGLVFEILGQDLLRFLKQHHPNSMPLTAVRPILQQLLIGLAKLKQLGVIHTDIKPSNIMLVDPVGDPYRVKIIDFGSARQVTIARCDTYIQTRYYRSPEIILGLPFSAAIDMWSLGCTAAELVLGSPLFAGGTEYDQIRLITALRGFPSQEALEQGSKTIQYFVRDSNSADSLWNLKSVADYLKETGMVSKDYTKHSLKSLSDIRKVHKSVNLEGIDRQAEKKDRLVFVDLLSRMLTMPLDDERLTPVAAMFHPFMRMTHLNRYTNCDYVRRSVKMMKICRPYDHLSNTNTNHGQPPATFSVPPPSPIIVTKDGQANKSKVLQSIENLSHI